MILEYCNPGINMSITNIILLICGLIPISIGIGTFINPNLSRWINAPGIRNPTMKGMIAIVVGIIIVIMSVFMEFPE